MHHLTSRGGEKIDPLAGEKKKKKPWPTHGRKLKQTWPDWGPI